LECHDQDPRFLPTTPYPVNNRLSKFDKQSTYLDNITLTLEDRASQRCLPSVIHFVWIRTMLYKKFDKWCVTMVRSKHDLIQSAFDINSWQIEAPKERGFAT
jgi:hypothetical protein